MKRALLSLLLGTLFVIGYFIMCSFLWGYFRLTEQTLKKLLTPLNLPRYIYHNIFGLRIDESYWLIALEIVSILLMYSAIFYFAFTLYAKITAKSKDKEMEYPPNPPVFNSEKEY
jgi:hypothetical protein